MTAAHLVVGPRSRDVIVELRPTAWVVFERLALRTDIRCGHLVAEASVRSLAAEVGLDKDTVAAAVGRLRRAGLVEFVANRFERDAYRLAVPADVLREGASAPESRVRPRPKRITTSTSSQLSLLDRS